MRRWLAGAMVGLVLTVGVAACSTPDKDSDSTGGGPTTHELEAFDTCKTFVKRQLKAPSTAKFRDPFGDQAPVITSSDKTTFEVVSSVDAENSFGASLRQTFDCVVKDQGDSWHLESLNIDDGT